MNTQQREELNSQMTRLADGDRSAFDVVFDVTWPIMHRFAVKTIGASQDAEDVAQHALLKVFNRALEFRRGSDALLWILGITAYECKTHRKSQVRRREDLGSDELMERQADHRLNAEDLLINSQIQAAVRECLNELSQQDQEAILASIDEMERPSVPAATYRKRLDRAFGRLRSKWSDKHG